MVESEFMKLFPIFAGLDDSKIQKLITIVRTTDYPAGSIIIKDGDHGNEMFLLLEGDVEVTKQMVLKTEAREAGAKDKSLLRLSSKFHACFGEMALFEEKCERSATVSAVTPCKVGIITQDQFTRLVESDHELGYIVFRNLSRIISDRLKKASKDILKLTTAFVLAVEK